MRLVILLCLLTLILPACGETVIAHGTMNGNDPASGTVIDPINVWNDYQTRARVVTQAHHGQSVDILEQTPTAYRIRVNGVVGWVGRDFVTVSAP
jgi:hypothetical protein